MMATRQQEALEDQIFPDADLRPDGSQKQASQTLGHLSQRAEVLL